MTEAPEAKVASIFEVEYWVNLGLPTRAAKSLVAHELLTLEDLKRLRRRKLLSIRGVGETTLGRLEVLLGTKLPPRSGNFWRRRGVNPSIIRALHRADILSLSDLAEITREEFLSFPGLALRALSCCEALLGRPLVSSRQHWIERGLTPWAAWKLSASRIHTPEELGRRLRHPQFRLAGFTAAEMDRMFGLLEPAYPVVSI